MSQTNDTPMDRAPQTATNAAPSEPVAQYATMGEMYNFLANELDETRTPDEIARLTVAVNALDVRVPLYTRPAPQFACSNERQGSTRCARWCGDCDTSGLNLRQSTRPAPREGVTEAALREFITGDLLIDVEATTYARGDEKFYDAMARNLVARLTAALAVSP